ncbi:HAD family hydrolase [Natronohydrobacter thiooxidans]|uniref:HAD family hydrolase n=1 Tax=Natronohydrobacter thiooxidans TaxID=87172 RepID=UPI0008FF5A8D|nr:HAD-IA family hydrolase [Natronohydrobacter thiooxidans]
MTPDLIIFDCDGVVVDSEAVTQLLLRDELALHGLEMTVEEVTGSFIGGTMHGVAEKARALGAALPLDWVDLFYARLYARLAEGTELVAGITGIFDRLEAAGRAYCIASNGRLAKMQITLGQHPATLARLAGRIFSAEQVPAPKPAPDLFLHAAQSLGRSPAACIVIEDSATGARAARAAGMRCFGFAPEGDGAHLAAEGAIPFRAMSDLPELLKL